MTNISYYTKFVIYIYILQAKAQLKAMQRQLLKEYNLYSDLVRLNHEEYFQATFDTPDTLQHFRSVQFEHGWKKVKYSCEFYFKNFKASRDKDVYLVLKWLITTHKIIQNICNARLLELFAQNINAMEHPQCKENIENYIQVVLINPYKQYLQKLCQIKGYSNCKPLLCNKENQPDNDLSLNFMKINLLKYSIRQFQQPCKELAGYFSKCYPFLCQFSKLIHQDLKVFLEEIKKTEVAKDLPEVQNFQREGTLDFLNKNGQKFLETPIQTVKIKNFFSSDPRDKIEISHFA